MCDKTGPVTSTMNDRGARTKLKRPMAKCIGSILSRAAENYDRAETCDVYTRIHTYTCARAAARVSKY